MPNLSFLEHYEAIIKSPSISAFDEKIDQTNRPLIDILSSWFSELGFTITIQHVPGTRNKFNMLAKIGSGEGGLLLSGHSDTVPFDEGAWQSDPFKVKQADGKLFGLGSCDMKGFFAFILEALKTIPLNKLKKPLYILATADEETSMAGARFFAQQQLIKPNMAIIGEPTELVPIYKHKGHIAQSLNIQGKAGHSSDPDKGVNAIEIMYQAIGQLMDLQSRLKGQFHDDDFSVPYVTMNLGHIHGGDGENRICGHCKLNFDLRAVPELNDQQALAMIDEALAPVFAKYPSRLSLDLMYPTAPAFACRDEQNILALAEQLTGKKFQSANYATEAPFINQLGCDTIVLGPGSIDQAHQPDEYISLDYVDPTVHILQQMINKVCL
ncbi:acetylornithine deacetylase [Paraglaciecola arctica]|uniref:Acetylornithine deacetylase n=1 Tax=Paraglaciecola arctica BSs20135 TaxID=493475 RepID=K6YZC5_9ALTE|nr:acetylornithine deacetylase [Paraglaciecola arctica]GAC22113.1 acetylornithine deacetylase [Paraglaciecola arctica BSs20135]|tara:strand:+ start:3231 stop:4376 length:1146 start_codon:yes stop_codon:yes gene_type:complete